jgi:hypothetical protein
MRRKLISIVSPKFWCPRNSVSPKFLSPEFLSPEFPPGIPAESNWTAPHSSIRNPIRTCTWNSLILPSTTLPRI